MISKSITKAVISLKAGWCFALLLYAGSAFAQQANSLTLEQCYRLAELNYPLSKQRGLIEQTKQYNIDNIAKGVYPQFAVTGTGTYQSDVTSVVIPGFSRPAIPKDQYNLHGEISQTLTEFGVNKQKREISATDADLQQANLDAELFKLRERINQVFFGVILIDEELEQNELSEKDIETGIARVQTAIKNGTDFKSSYNKLKAALLKADQHSIDLRASRKAYMDMLGRFINQNINEHTVLTKPAAPVITDSINRPELKSYDLQAKSYMAKQRLTSISNFPQLSLFYQGGIGNPSPVNFLAPGLSTYYITGVRLNWNIAGLYTYRKDKLINKNNQ